LKVGDIVYFTIRLFDGKTLGTITRSPSITIESSPPFVTELVIKGIIGDTVQDSVTTTTTAFADYNYFVDSEDSTNLSTIIWYVNGREFKRGTLEGTTNGFKNNQLVPGELQPGTGTRAIAIGNNLEVEIRPAAGRSVGNPVKSDIETVQNSIPVVSRVIVLPLNPTSISGLTVSYDFSDTDIVAGTTIQSDQSSIKWYRKRRGQSSFEEVTSLTNQNFVPNTSTASGDQWYAEVVPFDGVAIGTTTRSNVVNVI
jgi:hypothetical protein